MKKEKLWIFGCGDLGVRLASRLDRKSYEVFGVRRNPLAALSSRRRADALQWRRGDATRGQDIERLLAAGADVVVATFTPDEYTGAGYRRAYVDTATALADALGKLEKPPRLVIWVSSTRVYGQDSDDWVDEETPPLPGGFQGDALLAAEEIIRAAAPCTCVVRFAGIYGPGRERLLSQVRDGRCVPAQPRQYSNRIHVDDCIGFLAHLVAGQRHGWTPEPLYIGVDSEPVPLHDLQHWLAREMGFTAAHLHEELPARARSSKRLSNRRMLASGYELQYPDYRAGFRALLESD